jgi:hypothetical protein
MKKLFYHESTKGRKHERKEKFREVVSKPQIRFKGKASRGLKAERTR